MESYVVVDRSDVVDAIGAFVAAYLATLPEAQHMQPKQLQQALKQTFQVREACQCCTWSNWEAASFAHQLSCSHVSQFNTRFNLWAAGAEAEPHQADVEVGPVHLPLRGRQLLSFQPVHKSLVSGLPALDSMPRRRVHCPGSLAHPRTCSCTPKLCHSERHEGWRARRLVRAVLAAIWTASRVLTGLV